MQTVTKAVAAMVKCCCCGEELGPCFLLGLPASFEILCLAASIKGATEDEMVGCRDPGRISNFQIKVLDGMEILNRPLHIE